MKITTTEELKTLFESIIDKKEKIDINNLQICLKPQEIHITGYTAAEEIVMSTKLMQVYINQQNCINIAVTEFYLLSEGRKPTTEEINKFVLCYNIEKGSVKTFLKNIEELTESFKELILKAMDKMSGTQIVTALSVIVISSCLTIGFNRISDNNTKLKLKEMENEYISQHDNNSAKIMGKLIDVIQDKDREESKSYMLLSDIPENVEIEGKYYSKENLQKASKALQLEVKEFEEFRKDDLSRIEKTKGRFYANSIRYNEPTEIVKSKQNNGYYNLKNIDTNEEIKGIKLTDYSYSQNQENILSDLKYGKEMYLELSIAYNKDGQISSIRIDKYNDEIFKDLFSISFN